MRWWRHLAGAALLAAGFAACDLNPQPLPPGDDSNKAVDTPNGGADSNFGEHSDAAPANSPDGAGGGPSDSAVDSPPSPPPEAGDDAGDDGAADAADSG
jgi:hypothetical protein